MNVKNIFVLSSFIIIIAAYINFMPANITYAQSPSSNYVLNVLTGKAWEVEEVDSTENIEQGQDKLYFKDKYSGFLSKDINQIDIKINRYINFSFVNFDFGNIDKNKVKYKNEDEEYIKVNDICSANISLINTDSCAIVEKYIEFPSDIKEKVVSINLREFSHFIDTNTLINKFIFSSMTCPGKWGFKEITITEKPAGVLLRYDGYGYAPQEKEGTALIPQPFIPKKDISKNVNLIKEGDIYPREGTVYNDNGGFFSFLGYSIPPAASGWIDIIIPDEFIPDIKEMSMMVLDCKTEADVFSFQVTARNTNGELIIGGNDNITTITIQNTENKWETHKINLGEKISNDIKNTKIKLIRFGNPKGEGKEVKGKNFYEIELTDLHFEK